MAVGDETNYDEIITFNICNKTSFTFDNSTLLERQRMARKCQKILSDWELHDWDLISEVMLCIKILCRDATMSVILVNNTSMVKNVIAAVPPPDDCVDELALNALSCLYNLTFTKKELCEHIDDALLTILVQYAVNATKLLPCADSETISKIEKSAGGVLIFSTHTSFNSVIWDSLYSSKDDLLIFKKEPLRVLYACIKHRPEWISNDDEYHGKIIQFCESHLLADPLDFDILNLLFICSAGNRRHPDPKVLLAICDNLEKMPPCKSARTADYTPYITTIGILSHFSKYFSFIRKQVCAKILPKRTIEDIRTRRPEDGDTVDAKLIRAFTSSSIELSMLCSELVFVLCKENIDRFTRRTGFGNAAGLLANRRLLVSKNAANEDFGNMQPDYSDNTDSDNDNDEEDFNCTEQEAEEIGSFHPVLGTHQKIDSIHLENMSDEQKEREANHLAHLIHEMSKHNVITPMSCDPDGKQTPLNIHPGIIADSLKVAAGLKRETDSEEDSDDDV